MSDKPMHTPGPWVAELANQGSKNAPEFWCVVVDKPKPYRDAVVQLVWFGGIKPQDEPNARLIAAAPTNAELASIGRELAEAVLSGMERSVREALEGTQWSVRWEEIVALARRLIETARPKEER